MLTFSQLLGMSLETVEKHHSRGLCTMADLEHYRDHWRNESVRLSSECYLYHVDVCPECGKPFRLEQQMHPNEQAVKNAIYGLKENRPLTKVQHAVLDYLLFHVEEVAEVIESEVL